MKPWAGGTTWVSRIVRVTRKTESELGALVRGLVEEGETTNVEFKRELNVGKDRDKATFIKEILGLATTRVSGRRFLVIGMDDSTHEFEESLDPRYTRDRLEDILNAYSEPRPSIRFNRVPWGDGEIGIIEVLRQARDIPYMVKKLLGGRHGIREGDLIVRHGSHTEAPTELAPRALEEEGNRAREET